ncbi:MAG: HAMP domain-containing sensor histidine kinase [Deltaproteobacteria bacterium]|nr:HAMP domain-containing sensor histidine kinase [Deltaproteobacteria bacterium]
MNRRLYLQLYVAFMAVTVACLFAAGMAFRSFNEPGGPPARYLRSAARMAMRGLPPPRSPDFEQSLRRLAGELGVDILVMAPDGRVLGNAAKDAWPTQPELRPGWFRHKGELGFVVELDRGARVAIRERGRHNPAPHMGMVLLIVALGMALGCYPIARTITRRLEALDAGVKRWGQGELNSRLHVDGKDEVARVTQSFNQAAARIESLITQQREMLANASHELRSPLTRLRMALELIGESTDVADRQRLIERATQDIVELDALVEDVLLVSRADAQAHRRPFESVDVCTVVQSEAERCHAVYEGPVAGAVMLAGDASMLRHLVRNLLENAVAHGQGKDVRASLVEENNQVVLTVEDRGPGVPAAERDKIFAPFYRPRRSEPSPGTGLGLALVRQVARYHNGDVVYAAREGGGSRFIVTLPASA